MACDDTGHDTVFGTVNEIFGNADDTAGSCNFDDVNFGDVDRFCNFADADEDDDLSGEDTDVSGNKELEPILRKNDLNVIHKAMDVHVISFTRGGN